MAERIKRMLGDDETAVRMRKEVFDAMDPNGNHILSLAEVQKYIADVWPQYDEQRMLIRAFKAADLDGSGLIGRNEFRHMLKFIIYFDGLYDTFKKVDATQDHRIDMKEFVEGVHLLGGETVDDPEGLFKSIDRNSGGYILFDEFCVAMARRQVVGDEIDDETYFLTFQSTKESIDAADGGKVRSGAWWKGRMKLIKLTDKGDAGAKKQRKELFKRLDTGGDGNLSVDEVMAAVKKMWPEFDNQEACRLAFRAADRTGDGQIGFKEVRILLKYLIFFDDAWEIFSQMDVNADGKLSLKEFTAGIHLCHLSRPLSNPTAVFRTMDLDGNGSVELDEFVIWLAQTKAKDEDKGGTSGGFGRQVTMSDGLVADVQRAEKLGAYYAPGETAPSAASAGSSSASPGSSSSASSLSEFLAGLGLQKYEDTLTGQDVTTLEGLKCLEKSDLKEMGLSIGAASMILRSL